MTKNHLLLYKWEPKSDCVWDGVSEIGRFCVDKFLQAPLFDGKTFWEIEQEIEWEDD